MYVPDDARKQLKAAQTQAKYLAMSEKDVSKEIRRLEKDMLQAAKIWSLKRLPDCATS